jgi:hypothetical protein
VNYDLKFARAEGNVIFKGAKRKRKATHNTVLTALWFEQSTA